MSRTFLNTIVSLISFSVLGLIALQAYFLNNAYETQKEDVERSIKQIVNLIPERVTQLKSESGVQKGVAMFQSFGMGADSNIVSNDSAQNKQYEIKTDINLDMQNLYLEDTNQNGSKKKARIITLRTSNATTTSNEIGEIPADNSAQLMDQIMQEVMVQVFGDEEELGIDSLQLDSLIDSLFKEKGIIAEYAFQVRNKKKEDSILFGSIPTEFASFRTNLFAKDLIPKPIELELGVGKLNILVLKRMTGMILATLILAGLFIYVSWSSIFIMFKQKKISDVRRDFLNNMTHEFKTPIATIELATSALNNPSVQSETTKVQKYSELIAQENNRMLRQVESILSMAVTEQSEMALQYEDIISTELLESCVEQIKNRFSELELNIIINEDHACLFAADKLHLENAVLNILENAVKYRNNNNITILITGVITEDKWKLSIQDNGKGISSSDQKRVFDRFYRVPTGNRHDVKGFGIGLSYVKNIVNRHGGTVNLESELEKGSTFSINLPLEKD